MEVLVSGPETDLFCRLVVLFHLAGHIGRDTSGHILFVQDRTRGFNSKVQCGLGRLDFRFRV